MKRTDFNDDWTLRCLTRESPPERVTLPHDAMRAEPRVPESVGAGNIGWFAGWDYEYRKTFFVPGDWREQTAVFEFEGVYHDAEVFLNGEKAASRPYGYTNFYVAANPFLRYGEENEIRVIARNADQPNSRWYSGTGIYRPVSLWLGAGRYVALNGVKIRTLDHRTGEIEVCVRLSAPGAPRLEILDGGRVVCSEERTEAAEETRFTLRVPDAKLWDTEHPNLYTARVRVDGDVVEETFGIRTLAWDARRGITLNGERVILRGGCIHHDNGILGACTYPEVEERRVRILKEAGYNAVRSAHNPASKYLLNACDKLGMLMMDEYVDCWYMHKTAHDYASHVEQWWREDLKDLVEKDFNHPSVIMYSTGNEVAESAQERGIRLQRDFTDYLHRLDPTRPVTCGINIFFNFLSSMGMGVYSDEKAAAEAEAAKKAPAAQPKKKSVGSEFFNKLSVKFGTGFMKFGASLPPCDWKTRDVFAAMDIAGYNYGNRRYRGDAKKYPERLILGSETLIGDTYDFWETAKEMPQLVGDFVWAAWDYIGECGDSSPEFSGYTTEAPEDRVRGGTCRIDMTGKLTPEADYTRVAFELEPGPRLAVWPPDEAEKPPITGWQLTRAIRSWSWPGCDGKAAEVEVYARAAAVALFVNGERVGKTAPKKGRAVFRTVYRAGELTAVSYDAAGKELGRDTLRTAGGETELRLEPERPRCHPGEMVYFRLRCTDRGGETKPTERRNIHLSAENGTLMGAANASCCFKGNFTRSEVPTYFGEAQAVVRAGSPGVLRVTAADGARSVTAEVICEG